MKFRPAALRHLEAPEQLDQVVRLASAPAWLMTAVLAVIVAVAVTWATVGTVNTTVGAPGVLIHADGVSTLDATTSGQVARLWVPPGELATSGARLYSVQGADGRVHTVDAPWDAYVVSTVVAVGQLVEPGTPVADLERVSGTSDPLEAVVFVPAADAPAIQPGKEVTLTAAAVPSAVFGTLRGTVTSVGRLPRDHRVAAGVSRRGRQHRDLPRRGQRDQGRHQAGDRARRAEPNWRGPGPAPASRSTRRAAFRRRSSSPRSTRSNG